MELMSNLKSQVYVLILNKTGLKVSTRKKPSDDYFKVVEGDKHPREERVGYFLFFRSMAELVDALDSKSSSERSESSILSRTTHLLSGRVEQGYR